MNLVEGRMICCPSLFCVYLEFFHNKKSFHLLSPLPQADPHPPPATTTMIIQCPPPTPHSGSPTFWIVLVNTLDGVAQSPDYNFMKATFYWNYVRISWTIY